MSKTTPINTGVPAGGESPRMGDDRIRAQAAGIVELMQVDHYMGSPTGTAYDSDDAGKHSKVTLVEAKTIADQPNNTIARDSAGDLWFKDGSGNQVQLTSGGHLNGAALKDDSVNAAMIELLNNTFLTQKDSAGTARNLIGLNASNQTILGGTEAHDVRLSDATASGDDDRHIADKGYVDDSIPSLGNWETKATGTQYTAETDGFVVAFTNGPNAEHSLTGKTPATTTRIKQVTGAVYATRPVLSFTMPVKSGDTWRIDVSGSGATATVFWIPLT